MIRWLIALIWPSRGRHRRPRYDDSYLDELLISDHDPTGQY
jgi:hypothetical protein